MIPWHFPRSSLSINRALLPLLLNILSDSIPRARCSSPLQWMITLDSLSSGFPSVSTIAMDDCDMYWSIVVTMPTREPFVPIVLVIYLPLKRAWEPYFPHGACSPVCHMCTQFGHANHGDPSHQLICCVMIACPERRCRASQWHLDL